MVSSNIVMYRYSIVIKCMGRAVIEGEVGRGGERCEHPSMEELQVVLLRMDYHFRIILVMCSVSTNGERASLANLKLTIGSLLECS